MARCPDFHACLFYNDRMRGMPENALKVKEQYCDDDFKACARYRVAHELGERKVPSNLLPNQNERAKALVGSPK